MSKKIPFKLFAKLSAFEKSGDEFPMRIGGVVSTEALDKQKEVLVQEGLDFGPFLQSGWFNDNHSSSMTDVLGFPTDARLVKKGETLPNGKTAEATCWWAEGRLLNTARGRETWELVEAMEGTPRSLCFSVEGGIESRDPKNPGRVTKGTVEHVAITHVPVNPGTYLQAFAKALAAGTTIGAPVGGTAGDGSPLRVESLDSGVADEDDEAPEKCKKKSQKAAAEEEKASGLHKALQDIQALPPNRTFLKSWSNDILLAARAHARSLPTKCQSVSD